MFIACFFYCHTASLAMYPFKPILFILLFSLSGFQIQTNDPHLVKWVINKGCSLKVGGSTNVNKFSCVIHNYNKPDTLIFHKSSPSQPIKMAGLLTLDVQNFDCHNPVMTGDLRKTLKAKEFPHLIIRFMSLSSYPDYNNKTDAVKGIVTIELAGVRKQFAVDYKFIYDGPNSLVLTGRRQINFSDFNIVPPTKIGGMIRTNDELSIEFNLCVKAF
jgi:hypothetical protein